MTDNPTLQVGGWTADRMQGRLHRVGEERAVEPKVMDLLFLLASEPGRVFSHEEIRAALWPDTTVGEDSLARCVSKLRRALSCPDGGDLVRTIPKRGYQLIEQSRPGPHRVKRPALTALATLAAAAAIVATVAIVASPKRAAGVSQAEVERARSLSATDAIRQSAMEGRDRQAPDVEGAISAAKPPVRRAAPHR